MLAQFLAFALLFSPLLGSSLTALFLLRRPACYAQVLTLVFMLISTFSAIALFVMVSPQHSALAIPLYQPFHESLLSTSFGLYIDRLALTMSAMVTFISFLVHLYSCQYMNDDKSQPRFFAYISLFTFMMLLLVLSDNLLMLFASWEGVGLVSYLLIGFWMEKPKAVFANLKAFLINRFGDLGFLLAIVLTFSTLKTFSYVELFTLLSSPDLLQTSVSIFGRNFPVLEVMAGLYFLGAMAKSAQIPLHVWLPDSMEGPTPISALIHAATMVTAGVFLVVRLSPLFVLTPSVNEVIFYIGGTTAVLMGAVGLVQSDIKRIIAYSTLSQLGYMVLALAAGAYQIAIFHLLTHAFFKALLFLGAGAVIIALNHEQNIFSMGGLARTHRPLFLLMIVGALSLIGLAPLSGFYSKDLILITLANLETMAGKFGYYCALIGVYLTTLYTLRLLYYVFLRPAQQPVQFTPLGPCLYIPLGLLALGSLFSGVLGYHYFILGHFFDSSLSGLNSLDIAQSLNGHQGLFELALHGFFSVPTALIGAALITVLSLYYWVPSFFEKTLGVLLRPLRKILEEKFGFDLFFERGILVTSQRVGHFFSESLDKKFIDTFCVDGQALMMRNIGRMTKKVHSGLLQHAVCVMSLSMFFCFLLSL